MTQAFFTLIQALAQGPGPARIFLSSRTPIATSILTHFIVIEFDERRKLLDQDIHYSLNKILSSIHLSVQFFFLNIMIIVLQKLEVIYSFY